MTPGSAVSIVLCAMMLVACPAWTAPTAQTIPAPGTLATAETAPANPRATQTTDPVTPAKPPMNQLPRWTPPPGTSWQVQFTTPIDTTVDAQAYDIDGFEATPALVRQLHRKDRKVICYIDTGASEDFRPDHNTFPPQILGKPDGFSGENWLDIRRLDMLRSIMIQRFDMCQHKGFDAVDADLVDGYTNDTGFPLTAQDQLTYNRMLADLVHDRGMSIGLKNDLDQIPELLNNFDFAINEQCAQYNECEKLVPFIRASKAVFHVEYHLDTTQFCTKTLAFRFSSIRKQLTLDASRQPC